VIGHGEQLRPAAREVVEELSLPNSIKICYPVFRDHIPTRAALLARSAEIFTLIETGQLKVNIGRRYPLAEAAQAHLDIESRATTGKLLLLPSCSPQPWCER
jgi:NADPH2:quinone reductase